MSGIHSSTVKMSVDARNPQRYQVVANLQHSVNHRLSLCYDQPGRQLEKSAAADSYHQEPVVDVNSQQHLYVGFLSLCMSSQGKRGLSFPPAASAISIGGSCVKRSVPGWRCQVFRPGSAEADPFSRLSHPKSDGISLESGVFFPWCFAE